MDDKKPEETGVVTDTTPEMTTTDVADTTVSDTNSSESESTFAATSETSVVVDDEIVTKAASHSPFNIKAYVLAVVGILVICAGLLFLLEKEGRVSTGLFTAVIDKMEASAPAARVNGTVITGAEFSSSLEQLTDLSAQEGANMADAAVLTQLRTQAIETLVNAELLRQAALAEGLTATPEDIEARFTEISDGLGGTENLAARMAEFGVTEESLRKDIQNEFLIQALFDIKIDSDSIEVSEAQIAQVYEQAGGSAAGLPPLEEVREQIVAQIKFDQEQVLINDYLQSLRNEAEVEILI